MIRKPVIGITVAHVSEEIKTFPRTYYVESVKKASGQPILLPPVQSKEEAGELIQLIDGLVLTGGGDIAPEFLGEPPKRGIGECLPERDQSEIWLTQIALDEDLPLLGICRGIQVLAVAAGGSIVQDIPREFPQSIEHHQKAPRDSVWHDVVLQKSHLHDLMGAEKLGVNSFHHQAVARVPQGFIQNAAAPDGIIEGIEKVGARFCIGVQWHPEAMGANQYSVKLFQAFVNACQMR